jgi:hypothetical protein
VARFRFDALNRLAWILTGLLGVAWIGFEDRGLAGVTLLAWMISISALLTARARRSRREPILRPAGLRWWLLAGAAAGALAGPVEALLILLKVGLHAHPVPDFATADVVAVLARIPIWTAAGALLGAGAALMERAAGE